MSNGLNFAIGLTLLLLCGVYLASVEERFKRIVGSVFTVFVVAVAILYVYPPFDTLDENGKVLQKGKITLGLDLRGGTSFLIRLKPAEDPTTGQLRPLNKQSLDQAVEVIQIGRASCRERV